MGLEISKWHAVAGFRALSLWGCIHFGDFGYNLYSAKINMIIFFDYQKKICPMIS